MKYKPNKANGQKKPNKNNEKRLANYLVTLPKHPNVREHGTIASSFKVGNYKPIFKKDAVRRFLKTIIEEPTTAATISAKTGITHKYLCQLKRELVEVGKVEVIGFGKCPTTLSRGVQFLKARL